MDRTFLLDDEIKNMVRDIENGSDDVAELETTRSPTRLTEPSTAQPFEFVSFDANSTNSATSNRAHATIQIEIGQTQFDSSELSELVLDSIIELNESSAEPVKVLADGKIVAKGELVVIDGKFAVRITELHRS